LILSLLFLTILFVGFEAKPVITLRNVRPQRMDGEQLKEAGKEIEKYIRGKFEKISKEDWEKFFIHYVKAFEPKELLEIWYGLPKTERQCHTKAYIGLIQRFAAGEQFTPDEALNVFKEACPDSAEEIQKLYDVYMAQLKKCLNKIMAAVKKLPQAFQDVINKVYRMINKASVTPVKDHQEVLGPILLEVLQDMMEFKEEDLQKFAELCPDMAPILIGELRKPSELIIRAMIKSLKGGKVIKDREFFRAVGKYFIFIEEKIEEWVQMVVDAPEQDLPDFVVKGIEEDIKEFFSQFVIGFYQGLGVQLEGSPEEQKDLTELLEENTIEDSKREKRFVFPIFYSNGFGLDGNRA